MKSHHSLVKQETCLVNETGFGSSQWTSNHGPRLCSLDTPPPKRDLSSTSLLILERESIVAFALEDCAHDLNVKSTTTAMLVSEAIEATKSFQFDAAILDLDPVDGQSQHLLDSLRVSNANVVIHSFFDPAEFAPTVRGVAFLTKPKLPEDVVAALVLPRGNREVSRVG